ncbi:hypothetical protein OG302_22400 [Streptomyces sp. NBC_01283]|uniref:hypothetical protein n=1 Tax=Streptomyces sp. NBC_01283 TaxID=2903812 RepID=UPI00352C5A69|nr:hypothetical protein OG302_22400 [Streptomyces sp. NBC_01283]
MADLSMSPHAGDTTHTYPSELPAAITVARRMLGTYGTVDYGQAANTAQAHGLLAEALRILLRGIDRAALDNEALRPPPVEPYEPIGPGCGAPAAALIEGYSPRDGLAHGSLDLTVYACDEHATTARTDWLRGMTPYSMPSPSGRRCGTRFDYRTLGGGR